MAEPESVKQMQELMKVKGMLKIITNAHACQEVIHPSMHGFSQSKCDRYDFPITDPRHFELHDVVSVEKYRGSDGRYIARSKEGDYTEGAPDALLSRLMAHRGS